MAGEYTDEFLAWARSVNVSRRGAAALEALLQRGSVTTGDLSAMGYDHPPRAVRDLKDAGFVIKAENVSVDGRRMARYTLVDTMSVEGRAIRRPIPLSFRRELFEANDFRCAACGGKFEVRMLQADHRIPFEIGGDPEGLELADYMPLCGSDNRAKSMSCETCANWTKRDVNICATCYWHDPDHYNHLAGDPERRVVLNFQGPEVRIYEILSQMAGNSGSTLEKALKKALADFLE